MARCECEMILKLPDIRQRYDYDCGLAALDCAFAAAGIRTAAVFLANPIQGTAPDTVEALARVAGVPVLAGQMSVDDLQHFGNTGRPVLCPITLPDGAGHWVVSAGVLRGKVHYQDPLSGPQKLWGVDWLVRWQDRTNSGQVYSRWGVAIG